MTYLRGKRWRWARWIGVFLIISGFAIIAFRFPFFNNPDPLYVIQPYSDKADRPLVHHAFDKDSFWLTDNPQFSLSHTLDNMNPSQYTQTHAGKLQFKVLHEKGKTAGFVSYFKKSFYEGRILFLWVSPDFRGHGYGRILLQYAIDELFKEGSTHITLVTRVINTWGQKVYKQVGMKETSRDAIYVNYAIEKVV